MGSTYYMLECLDPPDGFMALLNYKRDNPLRSWTRGASFKSPPPTPVTATLQMKNKSKLIEMWSWPVPLMTKRLYEALLAAGVTNLDVYPAELIDPISNTVYTDYLAFNIIGLISAANLNQSIYSTDESQLSVDFDSLSIDEKKTHGALLFRLAESTNGIVIHESVKVVIESSGLDTLTFVDPKDWSG
jgi:hypothetical protein